MAKITKLQTLTSTLIEARTALDQATARLQPQINEEQGRVNVLRVTYNKANKAQSKAYDLYLVVVHAARIRLFPAETSKQLQAAIQARVGAGFPQADIGQLAREYEGRRVAADAEVVATSAAFQAASNRCQQLYRDYNVATNPGSRLSKLQYELEAARDRVASLERELERLPRYSQAAKDRRAKERQDAVIDEQTGAARTLLTDFQF